MRNFIYLLFILFGVYTTAQITTGIPADNSNNAIVNISSDSRAEIKGFSVPNYNLTSKTTDYLGDTDATKLKNSLLIFNTNPAFTKGLFFWDTDEWSYIADRNIIATKLANLAKINRFSTSNVNVTYHDGTEVNFGNSSRQHTLDELYSSKSTWTDYNFSNGAVKTINILNSSNVNIITASGTIQTYLNNNVDLNNAGVLGLGVFVKGPTDTDFKLKDYKIITANMGKSCLNFQFDITSSLVNLNSGANEVKVAMEFREIDGTTNTLDYVTVVGGRNTNSACNATSGNDASKQNYLPGSTMLTNLVIQTFENPNF